MYGEGEYNNHYDYYKEVQDVNNDDRLIWTFQDQRVGVGPEESSTSNIRPTPEEKVYIKTRSYSML